MRSRSYSAVAYFVAGVMVLSPMMDVAASALPFRPTDLTWRFAASGVLAGSVIGVLFGLLVVLTIAVYQEHRGVLRALGIFCALGFLAFICVIGLFAIDVVEVRSLVAAESQAAVGVASIGALIRHISGAIGTGLMAWAVRAELARIKARDRSGPGAQEVRDRGGPLEGLGPGRDHPGLARRGS